MFSKTNLISTLITALWAFLGGYLLWGILIDPYLQGHQGTATGVWKEAPDFVVIAIASVITGWAVSTLYSKWARGVHSLSHGAQFGILVGIIIGFGDRLVEYGVGNILDLTGTLVNGVIYLVFFGVMSALAGLVYSKLKSES